MPSVHYLVLVLPFVNKEDRKSCKCTKQCWNSKSRHQ